MKVTTITIQMKIAGNPEDALDVVDACLDNGVVQDPINDRDEDRDGEQRLLVLSALATVDSTEESDLAWQCETCEVINRSENDECGTCGNDRAKTPATEPGA